MFQSDNFSIWQWKRKPERDQIRWQIKCWSEQIDVRDCPMLGAEVEPVKQIRWQMPAASSSWLKKAEYQNLPDRPAAPE